MAVLDRPIAQPRHLPVGVTLAGIFLLLVMLTTGNLYLVNKLYDSVTNIADVINQSGRLRYLSQQIAFQSASFVLEPGEAAKRSEVEAEYEFKMRYAAAASEIRRLHPLMRSAEDNLEGHLEHIDKVWQRQHNALERLLTEPDLAARRAAQREVADDAIRLLSEADHLVNALEEASGTAHSRMNFIISSLQVLEVLLILWLFFHVRRGIAAPPSST